MTLRRSLTLLGMLTASLALSAPGAGAAGFDFDAAARYSDLSGGHAVHVSQGGRTLFEHYAPGRDPSQASDMWSATKTFWVAAAAAAVQDGLLTLDEPAVATLPEWRGDPRKEAVTIRHLLSCTSGFKAHKESLDDPSTRDRYQHAVDLPQDFAPGTNFNYGPSHYYIFGEVLKRKLATRTGEDPLAYLERRVLAPIGVSYDRWVRDQAGNPLIPNGSWLTARDAARFGRFLLDRGEHQGRQLVDRATMAQADEPGSPNPGYGLTAWLNRSVELRTLTVSNGVFVGALSGFDFGPEGMAISHSSPDAMWAAAGAEGQRIYVLEAEDLVVVRQGEGQAFRDDAFLDALRGPVPLP